MELVQKQIDAFLGRVEKTRTEMRRSTEGLLIVDQINDSLIFISPKVSYVYELAYIDNFVNRAEGPKDDQLVWFNEYLMKPVQECRRDDDPKLFLEILKRSMKKYVSRGYAVYADGKHVKDCRSFLLAKRLVTRIKKWKNNPADEAHKQFRNTKRVQVVDPAGNDTWFILEGSVTYDAAYTR